MALGSTSAGDAVPAGLVCDQDRLAPLGHRRKGVGDRPLGAAEGLSDPGGPERFAGPGGEVVADQRPERAAPEADRTGFRRAGVPGAVLLVVWDPAGLVRGRRLSEGGGSVGGNWIAGVGSR